MNVVSTRTLVGSALSKIHHRSREEIDLVFAALQRHTCRIKRARGVRPIEMTDQSHLPEHEFLAANAKENGGGFSLAELKIRLAYVHRVFEWRCIRLDVFAEGLRVLSLELKPHPLGGTHAHIEPYATQHVCIAVVGPERAVVESFEAHPVFTTETKPCRQLLVDVRQHGLHGSSSRRGRRNCSGLRWRLLSEC